MNEFNYLKTFLNNDKKYKFSRIIIIDLIKKILVILLIYFAGTKLIKITNNTLNYLFKNNKLNDKELINKIKSNEQIIDFIIYLIDKILYLILYLIILNQFGLSSNTIITLVTALFFTIVYSLKESLSNFASCILIFTVYNEDIVIGDVIEINNIIGIIDDIELFSTRLRTFDNRSVLIPNNDLIRNKIINYNKFKFRRIDTKFQLEYKVNFDDIFKIIEENFLIKENKKNLISSDFILKEKTDIEELINKKDDYKNYKPRFFLESMRDNGVYYNLRCYVRSENYYSYITNINKDIKSILDKQMIIFPFPQLDVHFNDNDKKKKKNKKNK